jgi:hypothetical protein
MNNAAIIICPLQVSATRAAETSSIEFNMPAIPIVV